MHLFEPTIAFLTALLDIPEELMKKRKGPWFSNSSRTEYNRRTYILTSFHENFEYLLSRKCWIKCYPPWIIICTGLRMLKTQLIKHIVLICCWFIKIIVKITYYLVPFLYLSILRVFLNKFFYFLNHCHSHWNCCIVLIIIPLNNLLQYESCDDGRFLKKSHLI